MLTRLSGAYQPRLFFVLKKIIHNLINQFSVKKDKNPQLKILQEKIGYSFQNPLLLTAALSHTSLPSSNKEHSPFERMEFLGDAILGLIISEELFLKYPNYSEGELSKLKSKIVSKKMLALKAKQIDLHEFILLSSEAANSGGLDSILADSMEAIISAIYLDGNLEEVRKFIKTFILKDVDRYIKSDELIDFKSKLQEYTQAEFHTIPNYKIINETGPEHEKIFTIEVLINNKVYGSGKGGSKKEGQQNAARESCNQLNL